MTIIVATRDRIVSDSRLASGDVYYSVGKIFRLPDGGLLSDSGDARLTYAFEKAFLAGEEPEALEPGDDDEQFEGVILRPSSELVLFTGPSFSPFPIGDTYVVLGNWMAVGAARSWLKHGASPEEAVGKAIEVDPACGGQIVTVMLHEKMKVLAGGRGGGKAMRERGFRGMGKKATP